MSILFKLACRKHPKYRAILSPVVKSDGSYCEDCYELFCIKMDIKKANTFSKNFRTNSDIGEYSSLTVHVPHYLIHSKQDEEG